MKKTFLFILLTGFCLVLPQVTHGASLLNDHFTGTAVSSSNWHIPTWVSSTDGTYVGRTQFMCSQNASLPKTSVSNANITVQSYNPTGFSFYGTDLISNTSFSSAYGISVTVRAKMNTSTPGIVGGIFLYALKPGSTTLHDEIDFELLTNSPNQAQTNIYGNEPLGVGNPQSVNYASGTINTYHTYEIRWLPTEVSWYIDGNLVRTNTANVPKGPMNFHLNIWVPDSTWPAAYSSQIQPTSSAGSNKIYSMSIDSVNIQTINSRYITILSPNGTTCTAGQSCPITWNSTGVDQVSIAATIGSTKLVVASPVVASLKNYAWTVPSTYAPGSYTLTLTSGDGTVVGSSKFTIVAPSRYITVLSPKGTTCTTGQLCNITWNSSGVNQVSITATIGSTKLVVAASVVSSLGKYAWTVPATYTPGSYTLTLTSGDGAVIGTSNFNVVAPSISYSNSKINVGNTVERRFYYGTQHFMTVILDANSAIAIRPHPGVDINGWGSTLYLQPFLPGAVLRGTTVQPINVKSDGINVVVSGIVSKGTSASYGTWNGNFTFSYNPALKEITGSGTYNISLSGMLSSSTGDLNLYKIASNYLVNVPLLNGSRGNTGDMSYATVSGGLTWIPSSGSTYPQDYRNPLSVAVIGTYNQVNTLAQGYPAIAAAYKPSMTVTLTSNQLGLPMIFGASYDSSKSQQYWADNVGITPLILKSSTLKSFNFDVSFSSKAIAGDH